MVGLNLAIVLLLTLVNGLLSMSELAVVSARSSRLQQAADEGHTGARVALKLAADPSRFLSTVQIGITLIGIINGVFGGATLSAPVEDKIADVPRLAPYSGAIANASVVILITYITLIIGELVPKRLALLRAEQIAMTVAPVMKILATVTAPIVWFLSISNELVLKLIRADQVEQPAVTEEEIRVMLMEATDAGVFDRAEQEMVAGVFGLGDRTAGELMTPRHNIIFLDVTDSEEINRIRMSRSNFHHYPVCEESTDNVIGIVSARDLWQHYLHNEDLSIRATMKDALFVPEISPVLSVLQQMRDQKQSIAIVIDEFGGVEGLLTVNDVLGGIVDEIGSHAGDDVIEGAVLREDGTWLLDGVFPAHEFRDLFSIKELPGENEGHFETIGGFILDQLGHIPTAGEWVVFEDHRIEVIDMDGHRIDKVLVTPPVPVEDPPATVATA